MTDEQLADAYRRDRHRRDLDLLLGRYVGRLRGMIHGMVLNQHDADDLTQEVFLRAIRGLEQFNGRSKFSTWLYRVAINTTHRFLERRARSPVRETTALNEPTDPRGQEPDRRAMQAEMQGDITAGLAGLSPPLRAAMVLMTLEGLPAEEAAEIEGCSTGTMYWRVHEARKILKTRLAKYLSP